MEHCLKDRTGTGVLDQLGRLVSRHAMAVGDHPTPIAGLSLHRRNAPTTPLHCLYGLGLGVTVQGQKQVATAERTLTTGAGEGMLVVVDAPAVSHVSKATYREPYLGVLLSLDPAAIVEVGAELNLTPQLTSDTPSPFVTAPVEPKLLEAILRLVQALDEPDLAPQLAALTQREILIRLLTGPCGGRLRQLAKAGSPESRILKAMSLLKKDFAEEIRMDDLAAMSNLSPSAFRQHFRAVTGLSPLQYQKQLRLQEARQAMLMQNMDATQAARHVGYESASQFSREYSRLFGAPPQRDIRMLRSG